MKKIIILMLALVMTMGMQAQTRKHTTARRAKTTHTTTKATVSNVNFAGSYSFLGGIYRICGLEYRVVLEAVGQGKYKGTLRCNVEDVYDNYISFDVTGTATGKSIILKMSSDAVIEYTTDDDLRVFDDCTWTKGSSVFKFTRNGSNIKISALGPMACLTDVWKNDFNDIEYTESN